MNTIQFDSYEIREVGEFSDGIGNIHVEPLNGKTEWPKGEEPEFTFWTLYGHRPGEGVEAIADRDSFEDIRELYYAITGVVLDEEPSDYFGLGRGHPPFIEGLTQE